MTDLHRRKLKFDTLEQCLGEVDRLRGGAYAKSKEWNLEQICAHLAHTVEGSLVKPPTDEATPEQVERKNKFLAMVLTPDGMPENIPLPPDRVPPADSSPAEVDRFIKAMRDLEAWPHKCLTVGSCGPVAVSEIKPLHYAHAAHHLGFLVPLTRREGLRFADADAVIADIHRLQAGCIKTGNWTLAQACWHLNFALRYFMSPGPHAEVPATAENRQRLEAILSGGKIPGGIQSPDQAVPPPTAGDADIEAFIATLARFKTFNGPFAPHRLFGKLTLEQGRKLALTHSAHHLSYLVPTT
jgi:hypothetical protein